jgi:poly-beta-1,6-N-acetyl-D-glucosamine synthase
MTVANISLYIFFISLGLLLYTYLGYGLLAGILGLLRSSRNRRKVDVGNVKVTVIIPAYNEANILGEKISNTLNGLKNFVHSQVIVITDGSNDGSNDLQFSDPRILHLHEPGRLGKSSAINKAMQHATGEIVIITDANAMVNEMGFAKLVSKFDRDQVGAVSGEKKVQRSDGSVGGEGIYWKYESFLKKQSAKMYSLTGAAGELIAIRKNVFNPIPADAILDDLQMSLDIIRQHKIVDYEPGAFASEPPSRSLSDEFRRKVRISAGVFQTLHRNLFVFNPFRHSVFVFQFFSHRILRWVTGINCLLLVFISNLLICLYAPAGANYFPWFFISFILQSGFYLFVMSGFILRNQKLPVIFFLPFYFVMMNVSILLGFMRYLGKKESVMWKKAAR